MSLSVPSPAARPLSWTFVWVLLSAAPALAQNAEGMFVTIPNPITSDAVARIKAQVEPRFVDNATRPKPATIVFDFNPDGKAASTIAFGSCLDLRDFLLRLNLKTKTVAFVHGVVSGHTVLPVLACQDVVMSKNAVLGPIRTEGVEALDSSKEGVYASTLETLNRATLSAVVRKMYDSQVKLRKGIRKAEPFDAMYFDAGRKDEVDKIAGDTTRLPPVEGTQDGQLGSYPATLAKDLRLARWSADTRAEAAELYDLSPSVQRDDPLQGRSPAVFQWTLKGDVDGAMQETVNRVIRDIRRKGGNVLILIINCGGTDLVAARRVADDLRAAQSGDDAVQIVGFITDTAPAAGTVVALGCNEIVMVKTKPDANGESKEAEIGDFSRYVDPKVTKAADIEANLPSIRELAEAQGYPAILIDGMFKKDIEIVRVRPKGDERQNQRRLITGDELAKNPDKWQLDAVIKPKNQLLKLNATRAVELGLARTTVESADPKAVTAALGWPDPQEPDPGWLNKFADFLRLPVVTVLLVVLGFTGLILELKVPGLTVPGIIAALCFILVFWAQSRFSGETFVLALLLFLLGLVLIGMEIFVLPGFGACGVFGILCMLGGLALVTLDRIPQSGSEWGILGVKVSQYLFAMMGALGLAFFLMRFLPKMPYTNRLVLNAPIDSGTLGDMLPGASEAAELLGAIGTTNTPLRPAGVVKFGDKFVDVVSDGGFIPSGTRVQVVQVEGTRIVVKEV